MDLREKKKQPKWLWENMLLAMFSMGTNGFNISHRIRAWYIYLHLVDVYGKGRAICHTWIGRDLI